MGPLVRRLGAEAALAKAGVKATTCAVVSAAGGALPGLRVLSRDIDEKSQIQALDRTQAGLPIKPGRCQTMTHDYKRHGTTTLFAALSVLDGTLIGRCMQRHRHSEFTTLSQRRRAPSPDRLGDPRRARQLRHP
jgi:hypothetical protein